MAGASRYAALLDANVLSPSSNAMRCSAWRTQGDAAPALDALRRMRERWRNPAYTPQALAGLFELRGMPLTAVRLQEYVGIL